MDREPDAIPGDDPRDALSLRPVRDRALSELEARLFGRARREVYVGRYVLGDRIGSGGFGVVHEGRDPALERPVAIKILRGGELDADATAALVEESRTIAALNHPNVVQIFDVGVAEPDTLGEGRGREVYLVLELLTGGSLRTWLRKEPRPQREILTRLVAAGRGLAAAHEAGIAHLDFKPGNVLLDTDGNARVLDFGLARHFRTEPSSTELDSLPTLERVEADRKTEPARHTFGTPRYMSPEAHRADEPGLAADQYALALVTVEALSGRYPFEGAELAGLYARKMAGISARQLGALGVPRPLARPLARGLSPDPLGRFASIAELVNTLDPDRSDRSVNSRRRLAVGAVVAGALTTVAALAMADRDEPRCESFVEAAADQWAKTKPSIEERFAEWDVEYAATTQTRLTQRVDAIVDGWTEQAERVCLDRRAVADADELVETCLLERLSELQAALGLIAGGDDASLRRSLSIVSVVGDPTFCARDKLGVPVITADPAAQKMARALREQLYSARALYQAGEFGQAAVVAQAVRDSLEDDELLAVRAEAEYELGAATVERGDPRRGMGMLEAAYHSARAAGHERIAVAAAIRLASVASRRLGDDALSEQWVQWAEASLARLDHPGEQGASLTYVRGLVAHGRGELQSAAEYYAAALHHYQSTNDVANASACLGGLSEIELASNRPAAALELAQRALSMQSDYAGPAHPSTTAQIAKLAKVEQQLGDLESAREHLQVVVERHRGGVDGPAPDLAASLINLGAVEYSLGELERCLALQEEALGLLGGQLGEDHPFYAIALDNIGALLRELGRAAEAVAKHEFALKIQQRILPEDHPQIATTMANLGLARSLAGQPEAGRQALDDALTRASARREPEPIQLATIHWQRGLAVRHGGGDPRPELRASVDRFGLGHANPTRARALFDLARAEHDHRADAGVVKELTRRSEAEYRALGDTGRADDVARWWSDHFSLRDATDRAGPASCREDGSG